MKQVLTFEKTKMNSMSRYFKICLMLTFVFLAINESQAQRKKRSDFYGKSNIDMFRTKYKRHAVIFSVGATNMFSRNDRRAVVLPDNPNREYFFTSGGKWGAMGEIGMLHFTKRTSWRFIKIDHYDWAIGVKTFGGWEETRLVIRDDPNSGATGISGRGEFSLGYVTGRLAFHNLIKLSPRIQLDQALGANFDYRLFGNTPGDVSGYVPIVLPSTQTYQRDFLAQLHYEIGFRIRVINMLHITPSFQIPVISAFQWSGGRSSIQWFSTRFQPWLLKFKFMIPLKEKEGKCPATYSNPDDERRNKEYLEGK